MALYNVARVNSLPDTENLQANTFYFVKGESDDQFFSLYTTGNDASTIRHLPTKSEITGWISEVAADLTLESVADIDARDALVPDLTGNKLVLVGDATGDSTVTSGAAFYFYKFEEKTWQKVSEVESMDLTLSWSGLQGKPISDIDDIDEAVNQRHEHSNKALLDTLALNETNGLTYAYNDELGTPVTVNLGAKADAGSDGLMSKEDFAKLAAIEAGAQANVDSFGVVQVGINSFLAVAPGDTLELASTTDALTVSIDDRVVNFAIANAVAPAGDDDLTGTAGLITGVEKAKLATIAEGAEANQNAFSNVQVGDTTIAADAKTDTVKFVGDGPVNVAADTEHKSVTISVANSEASTGGNGGAAGLMTALQAEDLVKVRAQTQFSIVNGNTGSVTATSAQDTFNIVGAGVVSVAAADKALTISVPVAVAPGENVEAANGLITGAEKAKLAGIAEGAQANQNALSIVTGGTGSWTAAEASDTLSIVGGTAVSTSISSDTLTINVAEAQSATQDASAVAGLMSANDKTKLDKFVVVDGALTYDGQSIGSNLVANEW